jgi:hypothetical protein
MSLYKLRMTTLGVHTEESRPVAIVIPAGTLLRVPDGVANAAGLVGVDWEGDCIQIFAVDLRERGELIQALTATGRAG